MKSNLLYIFSLFLFSCNQNNKFDQRENERHTTQIVAEETFESTPSIPNVLYPDGQYCASVFYTNPKTGTFANYDLYVKIEDMKLTVIEFPNGGWLDSTHFTPPEIGTGKTEFETYDGLQYKIFIMGEEGSCIEGVGVVNPNVENDKLKGVEGNTNGLVALHFEDCKYFIIYADGDKFYIGEKLYTSSFDLESGDRLFGNFPPSGSTEVFNQSKDRAMRIYINNYYMTLDQAREVYYKICLEPN